MAKVDIKLGTSLVQMYDGNPEHLNSFLDAVALFNDTVNGDFAAASPAQKEAAGETTLKFIKTRLTGIARQAISGAQTLNDMLNKLKEQCASKVNSDNIKAKLGTLKQKGSLDDFCNQVEKLTLQLATVYMDEDIPANKANQMATKQGVDTLISGLSNNEIKIILRAGKFERINEAIQKVQESDQIKPAQAQVFMTRGSHPQRGRGRGRGRFNGGRGYGNSQNRQNPNYQNNNYQNNNYQNNYQSQRYDNQRNDQNNYQRGNWSRGRGRYQGSNQSYQQYNPHPSMYFMQPVPQQSTQQPILTQQVPEQVPQPQQRVMNQVIPSNFLGMQYGPRAP